MTNNLNFTNYNCKERQILTRNWSMPMKAYKHYIWNKQKNLAHKRSRHSIALRAAYRRAN